MSGLGEGRENRREENAGAVAEGEEEGGQVVAGAAGEGVGGGAMRRAQRSRPTCVAEVETADGELGGEGMVGVEDEARVELRGDGVEKGGEARAVPGGLAQVVVLQARGEETRERGKLALVVVFGGDEQEFHRSLVEENGRKEAQKAQKTEERELSRLGWLG